MGHGAVDDCSEGLGQVNAMLKEWNGIFFQELEQLQMRAGRTVIRRFSGQEIVERCGCAVGALWN